MYECQQVAEVCAAQTGHAHVTPAAVIVVALAVVVLLVHLRRA